MSPENELRILEAEILGDAESTKMWTGLVAQGVGGAGEIASGIQAKKEAEKKTKAQEAAVAEAQKARNEANMATLEALGETAPNGPLHMKAAKASMRASELEAKAGIGAASSGAAQSSGGASFFTRAAGPLPVWGWGVVGVSVIGVIWGLVKLLKRKR